MPVLDYKTAFETGLEAARKSERAHKEINEVFNDFAAQLETASNGKLVISLHEFSQNFPLGPTKPLFPYSPKSHNTAISANNPIVKSRIIPIAKWKPASTGYPCLLSWGDQERYCEDKEGLQRCLRDLVADSLVGEKLLSLMQLEDGPELKKEVSG